MTDSNEAIVFGVYVVACRGSWMPGARQVPKLSFVIRFLEKNSIHLAKFLTTFLKSFTEIFKFLPKFSNLSHKFFKSSPKLCDNLHFSHFLRKLGRWLPPGWMPGDDPFFLCLVIYLHCFTKTGPLEPVGCPHAGCPGPSHRPHPPLHATEYTTCFYNIKGIVFLNFTFTCITF